MRRVERLESRSGRHKIETIIELRTCAAPDCSTRLSIYNPETRCAVHSTSSEIKPRRRRVSR